MLITYIAQKQKKSVQLKAGLNYIKHEKRERNRDRIKGPC